MWGKKIMEYLEKRRNIRVTFEVSVSIEIIDGINRYSISGMLSNISLKGLYIITEHKPSIGSTCIVSLHLTNPSQGGPKIILNGTVVRCDDRGIGIYLSKADTDSLIHLIQLMSHNSSKPDMIDQELLDWNKNI